MIKKIFISGASGYLGNFLISRLLEEKIFNISALNHLSFLPGASGELSSIRGDLISGSEWEGEVIDFRPEVIVHLAAMSSPAICAKDPQLALKINADGTLRLLKLAEKLDAFFILVSSDWVFDAVTAPSMGFTEETKADSVSVYGQSKIKAEHFCKQSSINTAILRSSLIYGPEINGRSSFLSWLSSEFQAQRAVNLYHNEWRTAVFVSDVVQCLCAIIHRNQAGIFHAAGPERFSRVEFAQCFVDEMGFSTNLINSCERPIDRPEDLSLNTDLTQQELDFTFTGLKKGLQLCKSMSA